MSSKTPEGVDQKKNEQPHANQIAHARKPTMRSKKPRGARLAGLLPCQMVVAGCMAESHQALQRGTRMLGSMDTTRQGPSGCADSCKHWQSSPALRFRVKSEGL